MPPTDQTPRVSFNQWLSFQSDEFAPIRSVWTTSRGRLTRETVIRRVEGVAPAFGPLAAKAFDAYLDAVGGPTSAQSRTLPLPGTEDVVSPDLG